MPLLRITTLHCEGITETMTVISNHDNPLTSALKEGVVIGIVASLRHCYGHVNRSAVADVLRQQQGWDNSEIEYFMNWVLIFSVED